MLLSRIFRYKFIIFSNVSKDIVRDFTFLSRSCIPAKQFNFLNNWPDKGQKKDDEVVMDPIFAGQLDA